MKRTIILFAILNLGFGAFAQNSEQNIRGRVIDQITQMPLPGATVIIADTTVNIGVVSDLDGYYEIKGVPVGRINVKVSFVGYKDVWFTNILHQSGKETILNAAMEENIIQKNTVTITGQKNDGSVNNEMATVSTRSFSVEETQRYAGARGDVARMASGYAGVNANDDSRNDIIIRGNSPSALLWRLDGVDVPNPNHFGASGTTGGPVSMLNNNLLTNSDFMTGAFPAEYGNAFSGVFDLKMRNGNSENHEFLGQIGFNGFELGAEGPINRSKRSSYLVNYRYSTLGVFQALGVSFGTGVAIPNYQDGSFKLSFPGTKTGSWTWFGLMGMSDIAFMNSKTDTIGVESDFYSNSDYDLINSSSMMVSGLINVMPINNNSFLKTTLSGSYHDFATDIDSIKWPEIIINPYYRGNFVNSKYSALLIRFYTS